VLYVCATCLPAIQSKVLQPSSPPEGGVVQLWDRLRLWLDLAQQVGGLQEDRYLEFRAYYAKPHSLCRCFVCQTPSPVTVTVT